MSNIQAALYARVSTEQQADANTINSQLAALRERVASDGFALPRETEFIDEGYSGTILIRPALERLRDVVASGAIDRLYVHSPDRLARRYAYQVLLVDEFRRVGVEVIFLNRELGQTPEDNLLLQVQGIIAEYERAKIIERNRRGKRHAAQVGSVNALCGAPYGYRYVTKQEGGGQARYDIEIEEARVVRQVFEWVGRDRLTIGEVCRRLGSVGEQTRKGKLWWDRSAVWGMLKNPAYIGAAAFGKTQNGPLRPRLRAQRGHPFQPRRARSIFDVPKEEWISIAVPALVDREVFDAVQEQLDENRRHMRTRLRGAKYLLQGLVACKVCGYSFYGKPVSNKAAKGTPREYAYYRCIGTEAYRFGGEKVCSNFSVRTDLLDVAVWNEIRRLLEDPARLVEEYRRRLQPHKNAKRGDLIAVEARLSKLRHGLARLIDTYAEGLIEKDEFEPRIRNLRERIGKLENQLSEIGDEARFETELRLIVGRLEEFVSRVKVGLDEVEWSSKRDLIRTLVKRVEVDKGQVNVVFRVDQYPSANGPPGGHLQHCWWRYSATLGTTARVPQPQRGCARTGSAS
jgi:site-specific DNA recombinase